MAAITPMLDITELITEKGGESLHVCMQCGTCTGVCPWGAVKEYSPRMLIRLVSLGLEGYEDESLWDCVTCAKCVSQCPRKIDIIDVIRATRSAMIDEGFNPRTFGAPLGSLRTDGNPWGEDRDKRFDWAESLKIPTFTKDTENLFFTCCTHAYDARNKKVIKDMATLLLKGGVDLGILGTEESCCGDQPHKCGDFSVYTNLRESNTDLFASKGVKKVIASSPHCMNTFGKHYDPAFTSEHYTQTFDRLISEGRITPEKEVPLKVAYHDPCYLGRHNGIYDEPRQVLQSIPGLDCIELPRNREDSLCCGGGGGGIWSEVPVEERFGVARVKEAKECGADVIATACPFCTIMLEDGLRALGLDEEMRVMDVAELLSVSVG